MLFRFSSILTLAAVSAMAATWDVPDTGNVATNGVNFQSAINSATCGDTIVLHAGVEYRTANVNGSQFVLPHKTTTECNLASPGYIDITSSAIGSLPAGVRVSPSSTSSMPKINGYRGTLALFLIAYNAHHYRLSGLYITADPNVITQNEEVFSLIAVDYYGDTPANWADSIVIDRCVLTPGAETGTTPFRTSSVGINAAGTNWTLTNSYI